MSARQIIFLSLVAGSIIGGACLFFFSSPPLEDMFKQLQTCPANEIAGIRIYDFDTAFSGSAPVLALQGDDVVDFLWALSEAEKVNPNHPQGGLTLFAEVDTTKWGTRHLRMSNTDNCGVLISIDSAKVGAESSWSAGTWRNDNLVNVFDAFKASRRRDR